MIKFEFRGIDAWIAGATRFGGEFGNTAQPEFDKVTRKLYELSQQRVHVITGELKASGQIVTSSSARSGMGIESLEGGVLYTSEHGFWEMQRGGEHDFLTGPAAEVIDDYYAVFDFAFNTVLRGW